MLSLISPCGASLISNLPTSRHIHMHSRVRADVLLELTTADGWMLFTPRGVVQSMIVCGTIWMLLQRSHRPSACYCSCCTCHLRHNTKMLFTCAWWCAAVCGVRCATCPGMFADPFQPVPRAGPLLDQHSRQLHEHQLRVGSGGPLWYPDGRRSDCTLNSMNCSSPGSKKACTSAASIALSIALAAKVLVTHYESKWRNISICVLLPASLVPGAQPKEHIPTP